MTSKTFDCAECGASVPYGRLSCPTCGALLASVTGALSRLSEPPRSRRSPIAESSRSRSPWPVPSPSPRLLGPLRTMARRADGPPRPPPRWRPHPIRPLRRPLADADPDAGPARCSTCPSPGRDPAEPTPKTPRPPTTAQAPTPAPTSAVAATQAGPRTPHYAPTPAVAARARAAATAAAAVEAIPDAVLKESTAAGRACPDRRRAHRGRRRRVDPRAHARPDGKGAGRRSCRTESQRGAASRDRASARALGDRCAAGDALGAARRACPGARRTPVSAPSRVGSRSDDRRQAAKRLSTALACHGDGDGRDGSLVERWASARIRRR